MALNEGRIDGAGLACLVLFAAPLAASVEGCEMTAQKTQSPLAGGQSAKENRNIATVPPAQKTGNNFAILKAKFALAGHKLQRVFMTTGETIYICSRWSMSRVFADLQEVESFLEKVTGIKS